MAARGLIALAAAAALAAAGCGSDDASPVSDEQMKRINREQEEDRAAVQRAIEAGKLPPVTIRVYDIDGSVNPNFIEGPDADQDVVRSSDDGASGAPLEWDLDDDGEISAAERRITERELYDASLRYRAP